MSAEAGLSTLQKVVIGAVIIGLGVAMAYMIVTYWNKVNFFDFFGFKI